MPSHTVASAVIKLWTLDFPWDCPTWQALTGVHHGLFPDDPAHLPRTWTPEDAENIKSYFDQYRLKPSDEEKIAFSRQSKGSVLPGRKKWRDWINSLWRTARIHEKIIGVFSASNCHPLTLSSEADDGTIVWPLGNTWIPLCLDAIASELFGEDCLDIRDHLPEPLRATTLALAQRSWSNLTKRFDRCKKRLVILEDEAIEAFDDLEDNLVTKAQLKKVVRAVSKWRDVAEIFDTDDTMNKIKEMEAELERLMEGLGANVKKKSESTSAPRFFKLSKQMLDALSTDEDVADVISLYHEHFDHPSSSPDDVPLIEYQPVIKNPFGMSVEGADPGVEVEATMSTADLSTSLGFLAGRPLLFNDNRHVDGLTLWSNPEAFIYADRVHPPKHIVKLRLHWHQLAGVHAIIRACFTPEPDRDHCTGVIIADEVGLGKTYQAATVIAFLSEAAIRQDDMMGAPILTIEDLPYLVGERDVPHLPHLIIFPGTLSSQWLAELHGLYTPGYVDIFVYGISKEEREQFWAPDGAFHLSRHEMSNRIILAPHSALQKDYNSVYPKKAKKPGSLPWDLPSLLPLKQRADISKTLYGQRYLSVTIDEAHNFRNGGPKHLAALGILALALLRMILSATPLQTATKDLAAMGRLAGIPHFMTEFALQEEREDGRTLRRAKKELSDNQSLLGDDDQDPLKLCQVSIAQRMQRQSKGHLIRRTLESKDWKGRPLIRLPPCNIIHVMLDLTPRELNIITRHGQALKETVGNANLAMKLTTRGFYTEYRLSVIFAQAHPNERIPEFESLAQWSKMKSTKLDTAARLCQYLLQRDNLALPNFTGGMVEFPPIPSLSENETATQDTKIVVFSEFPSMCSVLQNVFDLYGVKTLAVNGSMSYEKRALTMKIFRESRSHRVLALSSVGTTGINLAFCRVIIFLDQPWSAQDERQMRGRVHRQPQTHEVLCIHLLAKDTADIIVSGMARGKQDMMDAYLAKPSGQDMFNLLSGGGVVDPADDSSEDEPSNGPAKKSKSKGAKSSSTSVQQAKDSEAEEDEVAVSIVDAVPRIESLPKKSTAPMPRKRSFKSKAIVEAETDNPAATQVESTTQSKHRDAKKSNSIEEPALSAAAKLKTKAAPTAMDVESGPVVSARSKSKAKAKAKAKAPIAAIRSISSGLVVSKTKSQSVQPSEVEVSLTSRNSKNLPRIAASSASSAPKYSNDVDNTFRKMVSKSDTEGEDEEVDIRSQRDGDEGDESAMTEEDDRDHDEYPTSTGDASNFDESEGDLPAASEVSSRTSLRSRKSTASMASQEISNDQDDMVDFPMEEYRPYIPSPSPSHDDRPLTPPNRNKRPHPPASPPSPLALKRQPPTQRHLTSSVDDDPFLKRQLINQERQAPEHSMNSGRSYDQGHTSQRNVIPSRSTDLPVEKSTVYINKHGKAFNVRPSSSLVRRQQHGVNPNDAAVEDPSHPRKSQLSSGAVTKQPVASSQRPSSLQSHLPSADIGRERGASTTKTTDITKMSKGKQPMRKIPAANREQPVASSSQTRRDPNVTLAQLGRSYPDSSQQSTSSSGVASSVPRPSSRAVERSSIVASSGSSIPVHREPTLFGRQTVTPPPALPAKKTNPFAAVYEIPKKGGPKRR